MIEMIRIKIILKKETMYGFKPNNLHSKTLEATTNILIHI
jgi:hypothetical protein